MTADNAQGASVQVLTEEQEILQTLKIIVPNRDCAELRIRKKPKYWMSGFYDHDHLDKLARDAVIAETTFDTAGSYVTLNRTNPSLLARRKNRFDTFTPKGTLTSDNDIINWDYLPIDVDPARPAEISSSDAELELARIKADIVVQYLSEQGFPEPLRAHSGNGHHLLFRIDLPRSPENDLVVKTILVALDKRFSDDKAGIDTVNHNASRIFKLYGTMTRKGDNTPERPHRRSRIISVPENFSVVPEEVLKKFCHDNPLSADEAAGKKKKAGKAKDPKDVIARHPEFMKICGKMVNDGLTDEAITAACWEQNKKFEFPKNAEDFKVDVEGCIKHCRKRQEEAAKLPEYIYQIYNEETGELIKNCISYGKYAEHLHQKFNVVNFKKYLYVYDKENHIYREDINEIGTDVRNTHVEFNIQEKLVAVHKEVREHLENMGNEIEYPFDKPDGIVSVMNCALKVSKTIERMDHSPDIKKTVNLPIIFDPDAPTDPVKVVLSQWVDEQDVPILIQILAQALYQQANRLTLKRNYLLQGETDAGKSTLLDLFKLFAGETQISDVSLQEICSDVRFLASRLESKILNVYDDLKDIPLAGAGKLKKLDGRVTHEIERKGRTPYIGNITCPHIFSCNQPPSYSEELQYDEAWWNRWEFISFPFSFDKDATFQKRVFTPAFLSGLLNLVLEQMVKIDAKGCLTINHTSGEVRDRWGMLSNPLKMWVRDTFEPSTEYNDYPKQKLFDNYTKYCEDAEVPIKKRINSDGDFGRKLPGEGFFTLQVRDPENKKKKVWVWRAKMSHKAGTTGLVKKPEESKKPEQRGLGCA